MRGAGTWSKDINELTLKRLEMGLTQKSLASILGISEDTVNKYERGKKRAPILYQLALDHVYRRTLDGNYTDKYTSQIEKSQVERPRFLRLLTNSPER